MSQKDQLWIRLGRARVPVAKFHETTDSLYVIAPFPEVGLHLSIHQSGEIHLREGNGPILARAVLPRLNKYELSGWTEELLGTLEPAWIPSSDLLLFPGMTTFPGPLLRRVPGGQELDILAGLQSWTGELPFKWVEEGYLGEYSARFGLSSMMISPEEGMVGLPVPGQGDGFLAFQVDPGKPQGFVTGLIEAFPFHEAVGPLFDVGIGRLQEYEYEGRGFSSLFEAHVTDEDLEAFGEAVESVLSPLSRLEPRLRYPTDWEDSDLRRHVEAPSEVRPSGWVENGDQA